jgi:hypothetical protein
VLGLRAMIAAMPPGEHPHADRRNWQPASTAAEYLSNCREGLETYSEKRFAALLGLPRIELYRAKLMAELPKPLFERLLAAGILSSRALANVALAFRRGNNCAEVDSCPHCGGALRIRHHVSERIREVIVDWLTDELAGKSETNYRGRRRD